MFQLYINSYKGFSREVWWLAWITLINRAGTMVIPFLSLYLTRDMGLSLSEVGWIMSAFGLGSVLGSWLGGRLTDKLGNYKVMLMSLFGQGVLFILLQFIHGFWWMALGVFWVTVVSDAFRPAMMVALKLYSKPENRTRSITLIRLAINLGFTAGPAVGGLIITSLGYGGLFWVDGITCLLAFMLLSFFLHPKRANQTEEEEVPENYESVYSDKPFWLFFVSMALFGFVFLQLFSTFPLFYKDVHFLNEGQIGILLGANGLLIFLTEMPLIKFLESRIIRGTSIMIIGTALVGLSLLSLNLSPWVGILWISMIFISIGEMLVFPFSNAFALERSKRGKSGEYMAMYMIAFSISHIFGHNAGMQMIDAFGYETTWYVMTALSLVAIFLIVLLQRNIAQNLKEEKAIM